MTTSPGEFWVADIPFTNGQASKKRPVLILWLDGYDVVVAAVTSAAPHTQTDVVWVVDYPGQPLGPQCTATEMGHGGGEILFCGLRQGQIWWAIA